MTPTNLTLPRNRWLNHAAAAGVPPDQVANFLHSRTVLHPRQWQASAAARLCDAEDGPVAVAYGGARGGGKSFWLLAQLGCDDCQRYPDLKCLLLRKVGKSMRESFDDLRRTVLRAIPHSYSNGVVEFENGSRIILGHFKDEKDIDIYLGLEYDCIGIEEATTLTVAKVEAIRTANRTSKPGWRPRLYFATNPGGVGHDWFKQNFIEPHRAGNECETRFIPATVDDNRFIDSGYTKNLDKLQGWRKQAWRYGDWDIAAGQFFNAWRHETHVVDKAIGIGWRVWLALDHGYHHWTTAILMTEDGDGNIYAMDEWSARHTLVPGNAEGLAAMLERHGVSRKPAGMPKGDATHPHTLWRQVTGADCFSTESTGATIAGQYKAQGFEFKPANTDRINGAAEILARLGNAAAGILPRLFVHSRCKRLIACLPALQHDPQRPEDVLKWDTDDDGHGGDDAYDAFRYGVMVAAEPRRWYEDKAFLEWMKNR